MTRNEWFAEQLKDLRMGEKLSIYNTYCDTDDEISELDSEFWNNAFEDADDAVRAALAGSVRYADDYVRYDVYGDLESLTSREAEDIMDGWFDEEDHLDEMWGGATVSDYIDFGDWDDYRMDALRDAYPDEDDSDLEDYMNEHWDDSEDEEENIRNYTPNRSGDDDTPTESVAPAAEYSSGDGDPMANY